MFDLHDDDDVAAVALPPSPPAAHESGTPIERSIPVVVAAGRIVGHDDLVVSVERCCCRSLLRRRHPHKSSY